MARARSSRWWPMQAPASRGYSMNSRRQSSPSAESSRHTHYRIAIRRRGCRCWNCCAVTLVSQRRTILQRGGRKCVPRCSASTRRSKMRCPACSVCSALSTDPTRTPRWTGGVKYQRTLDAIKRTLLRESLKQPLAVIFEDLHWIDNETQGLLNLLAASIANSKILLLVNYRPEYSHQWGNKTYYTQLRLN